MIAHHGIITGPFNTKNGHRPHSFRLLDIKKPQSQIKELWRSTFSIFSCAFLSRLKVEDVSLNNTGIPLDFDFPALLVLESILIAVLCKKQTHFITSAPVSTTRMENNKLNHPSGAVLKAFHGKNVMSFQLPC
jgi:hypothetical protein